MSFSIRETYFICPFKINGQTSVEASVFMALVAVFSLRVIVQSVFTFGFLWKCCGSILAQVAHGSSPKSSIFHLLPSPYALSPSACCCPDNGMVEREEMLIAQRLSGRIWDLANKACTEWWCVWQCHCAKRTLVEFSGCVMSNFYPYCKLKLKYLCLCFCV